VSGAATVRGWARDVSRFADEWPEHGARVLADKVEQRLRSDTGGDGGFSRGRGLGRAGVEVDAGTGEAEVAAAGSMRVWAMLEHGTSGHVVRARRGRLLATPYGPRPMVTVSGMRARETWSTGVRAGMPAVQRDAEHEWARVGR
jgi:hypothetical protein